MKLGLGFLFCEFDHVHLIQLLLPRHRHVARGHARFIAGDKIFQLGDFLLLFLESRRNCCFLTS